MKDLDKQPKSLVATFDSKVFTMMAIKKAAYKYVQAFSADITMQGEQINCQLTFSSPVSEEEGVRLVEDFKKEVLDQDLRERLKAETEAVRNVILAHVFSKTGLITDESLSRD
jgi:His-Xaa-Ser system protein HxsD